MGGPDNMLLFPLISNNTDKSLKNFSAIISIWSDEPMHKLFKESMNDDSFLDLTDYSVISQNEYSVDLEYNKDILHANSVLPYPMDIFLLFRANDKISTLGGNVTFSYYITYDGAKKPIIFEYNACMYYDGSYEDREQKFSNSFKANAAYRYLHDKVFANNSGRSIYGDGEWVFIIQNQIYRNFKHLTSEEFENMEDKSYSNLNSGNDDPSFWDFPKGLFWLLYSIAYSVFCIFVIFACFCNIESKSDVLWGLFHICFLIGCIVLLYYNIS